MLPAGRRLGTDFCVRKSRSDEYLTFLSGSVVGIAVAGEWTVNPWEGAQ